MRPLYLAFTLLTTHLALADWTLDFYPDKCPEDHALDEEAPGAQVVKDVDVHACDAAPKLVNDNKGSKAIKIRDIDSSGLFIHLYSGEYCNLASHFATIEEDGCYNSFELVEDRTIFGIKVDRDREPKDNTTETESP
ncbi:MAG: hypothetical protein LQ351_001946 [Letrouitia transgressa]|nr:MAG: hypothetical protein LQ351_001946 [Letrouitia transgressa]